MPGIIPPPGQPGYQNWRKQHPPQDVIGGQLASLLASAMRPGEVLAGRADPTDVGANFKFALDMMTGGSPASLAERVGPEMVAGSGLLRRSRAPRYGELPESGGVNAGIESAPDPRIQTVANPKRMMYPGIYANPREIAAVAAERVAPESPLLKQLWGVNRGDLDAMARLRGPGNDPTGVILPGGRARGSAAALDVMNPRNAQRLQDTLAEAGKIPGLAHADAWYVMDPAFNRMVELFGPEEAISRYKHFNTMTGMASPGSDVMTELQRGGAAHWLDRQGRFADFMKYGGVPEAKRGAGFPNDMRYIAGHPYHSTSQAGPMAKYLERGELRAEAPKVPLYVEASGVPETGYQWNSPVGDAHWSRGMGLADTRLGPTDVQASFTRPEHMTAGPWFRNEVATPLGIQAVPAQARMWTVLGPQTGVDTALGQGKLELFSESIGRAANRAGISPEMARDRILSGEMGAGLGGPTGAIPGAAAGVLAPAVQPPAARAPVGVPLQPGTITRQQFDRLMAQGLGA